MDMLGERITQVRRGLGEAASDEIFSKERILHSWGSLLSGGFRMQTYRPDGEFIHRFRQLIAHELQTVSRQPLGIVAVESAGGPSTESNTAHIRGVCPSGTIVTVAGERITKAQGFSESTTFVFRAEVSLQPGRNLIPVKLDDGRGNAKTTYREIHYRAPKKNGTNENTGK